MKTNQTEITEFVLLGFGELHDQHIFLFLVFLLVYISTMMSNILTILLIVIDQHLHTPMYFFLGNLSCLEMVYGSTILPRMLASFQTGNKFISFNGCMTQLYFVALLGCTECYILAIMSYDRFLAICKPLHYATFMNGKLCIQLAVSSWINSLVFTSIYLTMVSQLWYCGPNKIDHFFCDSLPLMKLSCSDTSLLNNTRIILAILLTCPPFLLTIASYVCIIATILRIPSITGRQKAFSTCSSHLIVVCIFYGAIFLVYLMPKTETMREINKVLSLLYTVLPPLVNPLIYTLRNKDVREALRKTARKVIKGKCVVRLKFVDLPMLC